MGHESRMYMTLVIPLLIDVCVNILNHGNLLPIQKLIKQNSNSPNHTKNYLKELTQSTTSVNFTYYIKGKQWQILQKQQLET